MMAASPMSAADIRLAKLRVMAQVIAEAANSDEIVRRIGKVYNGLTNGDVEIIRTQLQTESANLMIDSLGL